MFIDTNSPPNKMGNELELIALVRNCEFLYNKNLPDFKDSVKRAAAWEAIAAVMNATGKPVKKFVETKFLEERYVTF